MKLKPILISHRIRLWCRLSYPLTCIWRLPGTGKTHTVAIILQELLRRKTKERVLVTVPTHNAVDSILRRYLKHAEGTIKPLWFLLI